MDDVIKQAPRLEGAGQYMKNGESASVDGVQSQCKDTQFQADTQMLPKIFRINSAIYERGKMLVDGIAENCITKVDRSYVIDCYGKEALSGLPKYDGFACVPGHGKEYREVIEIGGARFVNTYLPIPQAPADTDGPTPCFDNLMKRTFAEQLYQGLQYLGYLYQKPYQILPILCLVSLCNHSGKSAFFMLLKLLFGRNTWLLGEADLLSSFTPFLKALCGCFEEISNGRKSMNKLKAFGTAKSLTVNEKFVSQYTCDAHLKLLISSNDVKSFLKVSREDIRFWIREMPPMTKEEFIPDFESKLKAEIPYILYKLEHMELMPPQSRMVFSREQIQTSALSNLIENSKSDCCKDIQAWIDEQANSHDKTFYATATEISRELRKAYSIYEIRDALQNELDYPAPSVKRRYVNFAGVNAQGCPYAFEPKAANQSGNDFQESGNIPSEDDGLPF